MQKHGYQKIAQDLTGLNSAYGGSKRPCQVPGYDKKGEGSISSAQKQKQAKAKDRTPQ